MLTDKIEKHPEYGLNVVGYVDRDGRASMTERPVPLIGNTDDLPRLVRAYAADRVVIAFSTDSHDQTLDVIRPMQGTVDVRSTSCPMFEVLGDERAVPHDRGTAAVGFRAPRLSGRRGSSAVARPLGAGSVSSSWRPVPVIALWIKLDSSRAGFLPAGPHGSRRPDFPGLQVPHDGVRRRGRKAEVAHLNMHRRGDPRMFKVAGRPACHPGRRLPPARAVDELPQLINVVSGRDVARRPAAVDPRRGPARRELGAEPAPTASPGSPASGRYSARATSRSRRWSKLDYLYVTELVARARTFA